MNSEAGNQIPMEEKRSFRDRYTDYAVDVLTGYTGKEPLHLYLKKYFKQHKKHGSKDRKRISAICYHYFRLGHGVKDTLSIRERVQLGIQLFEDGQSSDNEPASDLQQFDSGRIFPFTSELSPQITHRELNKSYLTQPDLFLRIRPGFQEEVQGKLRAASIDFTQINAECISVANNTRLESILDINREAVIQDLSSQNTALFLEDMNLPGRELQVWDSCSGSGGKSILLSDKLKHIRLTVSDVRPSILHNLQVRFRQAGIRSYRCLKADLTQPLAQGIIKDQFDLILIDTPCSGSGTWGRTPEQLLYFDIQRLLGFAALQRKIVANCIPYLKKDGYLLYLTCSLFHKENEENIELLKNQFSLKIIREEYLKGYHQKSDTLFGALLQPTRNVL